MSSSGPGARPGPEGDRAATREPLDSTGPPHRPIGWRRALLVFAVVPLGTLLVLLLARSPELVEATYCTRVFPLVRGLQGALFGWWPFSASELLLATALLGGTGVGVRGLLRVLRGRAALGRTLALGLARGMTAAGVLYGVFLVAWGLNHARLPYARHAELVPTACDPDELYDLCLSLVEACNRLGPEVGPEQLALRPGVEGTDPRLVRGYEVLCERVPGLRGGRPLLRVPACSPLLSYLGISGIYSPFTGEAHLNGDQPRYVHAFAACHEVAHQRGFAREDECNFIAWQVCHASGDPAFAYSAHLVGLNLSLRALVEHEPVAVQFLLSQLNDEVRADREEARRYWQAHEGAATEVARVANDTYLRSQGQAEGVASYGRMVDLLLAERRAGRGPFAGDPPR